MVLDDTGVAVVLGVLGLDDRSLGVVTNLGVAVREAGVLRLDVLNGEPAGKMKTPKHTSEACLQLARRYLKIQRL